METSTSNSNYNPLEIKFAKPILPEEPKDISQKWIRYTNLVLLGTSFCLIFSAFATSQAYMTANYHSHGYIILGCYHIMFAISTFFSPIFVSLFGPRPSMILASFYYCAFVLSVGTGIWYFVASTSAILGFAGSVLWTAHGKYMTTISEQDRGLFNGIFFSFQTSSLIFGNLLGSLMVAQKLPQFKMYLVLSCIGLVGVIVMVLLRSYTPTQSFVQKPFVETFARSFTIFGELKLILLIPLIFFNGYKQAILYGKIPEVISGSLPDEYVGYAICTLGVSEMVTGIFIGKIADRFGNALTLIMVFIFLYISIGFTLIMHLAKPYLLFVTMLALGLADASLNTITYSILSTLYYQDSLAAFASFKLIQAVGSTCGIGIAMVFPLLNVQIGSCIILLLAIFCAYMNHFYVAPLNKE